MIMMNDHVIDNDTNSELSMIASAVDGLRTFMVEKNLVAKIDNVIIREKFNNSIKYKVNKLQKAFQDFLNTTDIYHKNVLTETCNNTNGMKDVLTDLHIEIVDKDGNNGTFYQLLDGGVSPC